MSIANNPTFVIRPACLADAPALCALCGQLGYPLEEAQLRPRLEGILPDPEQTVLVAETSGGSLAGWVHGLHVVYLESEPFIEIGGLVVDQACRRLGIGAALMQAIEAWALQHGIHLIRLRSNTIRTEAHIFYQRQGYTNVKSQYTFEKDL